MFNYFARVPCESSLPGMFMEDVRVWPVYILYTSLGKTWHAFWSLQTPHVDVFLLDSFSPPGFRLEMNHVLFFQSQFKCHDFCVLFFSEKLEKDSNTSIYLLGHAEKKMPHHLITLPQPKTTNNHDTLPEIQTTLPFFWDNTGRTP